MSHESKDIQRLLRAARRAEPDDEVLARVWQRLGAPTPTDPDPGDALDVPDPAALAAQTSALSGKAAFVGVIKVLGAAAVVAGAVVGGARWSERAPAPAVEASPAAPAIVPVAEPEPPGEPAPAPSEAALPEAPAPAKRPRGRAAKLDAEGADALAQERRWISVAQAALQRGDLAGAHAGLDAHARSFAQGVLADEREVLRVLALCAEDRRPEAAAIAQALIAARGAGLFLPRLRGSCVGDLLVPVQRPRQP